MKKLIIGILLLCTLISFSQEKKWRTLTFGTLGGVTLSGHYLQTFSTSLDYELSKGYSISSWTGVNYNTSYNGGWFSSSLSLQKKISKYNIGVGVMYGGGNINTPFPDKIIQRDISATFSISRRFKLN